MAGTTDTLRTSESVPENLKKRSVAGQKERRRKLNKKRKEVLSHGKMAVSQKIRLLMREGRPQKQAVVIALDMQRRGQLRK